jgi:hypothetical protein
MADPDQAVGSSFDVLEELAGQMVEALRRGREGEAQAVLDGLRISVRPDSLPLRYGGLGPGQLEARIGEWKRRFAGFLEIPPEEVPEDWSINALIKEQARRKKLDAGEVRRWVSEQFTYTSFLGIYKSGAGSIDAERGLVSSPVTLLDFGALKILGVPMEVLLDVAFDWQHRFGDSFALVCGLFGGWIGYLPHPHNHEEPGADQLYETVSTMFAPQAATGLLETAQGMARDAAGGSA